VERPARALAGAGNYPYRCRFSEHRREFFFGGSTRGTCRGARKFARANAASAQLAAQLGRQNAEANMKAQPTRHIVSINDLSNKDIETIFEIAQSYLNELPDPNFSYRIGRSTNVASNFILASLFYEPSTRTRLSFESAMLRLGGDTITSADPATSSAAKGESLADTVRVIANYADLIVIRHPRDGAARLAADYSPVPVINAGDGSHEHPTQTLCDLFTLKKKNKHLKNLKIAISGDLKGSRTIHSFVYALARFGANIMPMPARGMGLPAHVDRRLREEFGCQIVPASRRESDGASIDALYVTPEEPHQQSLFSGPEIGIDLAAAVAEKKIDAVYVTRFQKERWSEQDQPYPKIDKKFLNAPKYSGASVLHPLPRVGELDASLDSDSRAVYFQQAAYGVPVRMALISLLLGLTKGKSLHKFEGGFDKQTYAVYDQPRSLGMHCVNRNCIVHEPMESQYVRNRFHVVKTASVAGCKLRCVYCEADVESFVVAHKKNKWYAKDASPLLREGDHNLRELIVFAEEAHARDSGYHFRRSSLGARPARRQGLKSPS
jgi:aspartate carbamoyltransferase catalytic subunit